MTVSLGPLSADDVDAPLIGKGDAIVTGFSGVEQDSDVPDDVHPLDRTLIDLKGPSLKVFDLSELGGKPVGQRVSPKVKYEGRAKDLGQVFATALIPASEDGPVDVLAGATSFYGLHLVKRNGTGLQRILKGEPGAQWMPGLFSSRTGGGPGSIWRINGSTGDVSLFAALTSNGKPNAGPGIGGLAYDPQSQQIFASNLETGFIHLFNMAGEETGTFDHGETALWGVGRRAVPFKSSDRIEKTDTKFNSEDPATWGYAAEGRRVIALAVQNGRLYYSVAAGPEVWSVSIAPEGGLGTDARVEISLDGIPSNAPITKIIFANDATLYLSQRGAQVGSYDYSLFAEPKTAAVLRYQFDDTTQTWAELPDEIPVGSTQPHRESDGGVALGFGYDTSGQIATSQCAATVWTSGAHLTRVDNDAQSAPERRVYSGLQAITSSAGEPLNASTPLTGSGALQGVVDYFFGGSETAPTNTWIVPFHDPDRSEMRRSGHTGDLAIYAPCLTVADEVEPEVVIPTDPEIPPGTPAVTITKTCQPVGLGGVVDCTITVTNTGTLIPDWPVVFNDISTILAGPGAGTVTDITAAAPDGPDWFCTPTPTQNFACALPGFALPPGAARSVTVSLDTAGLVNAGNFGFENCATLAWPNPGIACDKGGSTLTFEKSGPPTAVASGDATYTLKIKNEGILPFNGNVLLTDRLFISGAPVAVPVVALNPDPGCLGGPPAAVPFSCNAPLTLAPGAETSFEVTVTLPADPANVGYWAHNCLAVTDPGFGPPPGPPGPGAGQSCVWTEVLPVTVASNIRVDKTALNGAKCQKAGGDKIECDYEITLTNEGPVAFSDFVSLEETVPPKSVLTSGDPGLVCGGGAPDYLCNTGGSVDLANGASISFPMKLTMDLPDLEAHGCEMLNRVKLASPAGGSPSNFKLADDEADASADAFMQWWVGGMLFITCDPTNIKTEKVAKGPCIKSESNWRCDYDVTLHNLGPDPLTSVIKLKETFSATPTALTFDAAWSCSGAGTTYECTHPVINLQKGDTLKFSVSAEVPDKGLCSLKNTASLTFPLAGTRGNSNASDDTASASATIPSKLCIKPLPEIDPIYPIVDPVPTCPDGSKRMRNGRCPCPRGEVWSRTDRACVPQQCRDPERRKPNGKCCPRGTIWNTKFGTCTKACGDASTWNPKTQRCESDTSCPTGTRWNRVINRCVPIVECSRYERWSWSRLKCVPLTCKQIKKRGLPLPDRCQDHTQCGVNEVLRGDKCVCKRGYRRVNGTCLPMPPVCRDPNAEPKGRRCVCKTGYRYDIKQKRCVSDVGIDPPPPPPPQCNGPNEYKNRYGMCVCKDGYRRHSGICVPKRIRCTDPNAHPVRGKCICKKGYKRVPGKRRCVPDVVIDPPPPPPPPQCNGPSETKNRYGLCVCKLGYKRRKGICEKQSNACRANDARCFCEKRGGKWVRGRCQMPETPKEKCRKSGGTWKFGRCIPKVSERLKCIRKGGVWKNNSCQPKLSKQALCVVQGKVWRNGRCQAKGPSAKEKCLAKGGRWSKGRCQPKVSKQLQCVLQGKVWKNGRCQNKVKIRPTRPSPPKKTAPKVNQKKLQFQNNLKKWQLKKNQRQSRRLR